MGRGIITSGGTSGYYVIELDMDRSGATAQIASLQVQINLLNTYILTLPEGTEKEAARLRRNAVQKKLDWVDAYDIDNPTNIGVWCADLTEDLAPGAVVGTIEVPGERGTVLIQPGYEGNAAWVQARDEWLSRAVNFASPSGLYYNLAMMPGWQKWKPTYRFGVISNLDQDANTATVALSAASSSQQSLDVNAQAVYDGVTIEYMSCNAGAFEDGDVVVVEFTGQNYLTPKVIGFWQNPKACGWSFKLTREDGTLITQAAGLNLWFACYKSDTDWVPVTAVYNVATTYWDVTLDDGADFDPLGHFFQYGCDDAIYVQYPRRYKSATMWNASDLITPAAYIDTIPYYTTSGTSQSSPWDLVTTVQRSQTVVITVPYKITYGVTNHTVSHRFLGPASLCTDPYLELVFADGSQSFDSGEGGFSYTTGATGVHSGSNLTTSEKPAGGGTFTVTATWNGPATVAFSCFDPLLGPQPITLNFSRCVFTSGAMSISLSYDY